FGGHFDLQFAGYGVDDLATAARKLVDFIGDDFSRRSRRIRTREALRSPSETGAGRISGRGWSSRIDESWIGGRAAVLARPEKRDEKGEEAAGSKVPGQTGAAARVPI